MTRDFLGNGHAQLLVNSPWGIGVLGLQGGAFVSGAMAQSGSVLGSWRLDSDANQIGPAGSFDGDAHCSFLMTSGWGIGALKASGGSFASTAMAGNGTALPVGSGINGAAAWAVDTANTRYGPSGRFNGDGRDVILARGAGGFATIMQAGQGFSAGLVVHDGALFGGAAVGALDRFGPAADFDGDGFDEALLVGARGVWVLQLRADRPGCLAQVANGSSFGGWTLDTSQDQFGPAGDFDGDGHAELVISRAGRFALLKVAATGFTVMALHGPGDWIGGWRVGGDRLGPAADFNGDRRSELLISSGWGVGVLAWSGSGWTTSAITEDGTACGQWRIDTLRDRMTLAADCDGDGRAELLVSSGWGAGLLDLSGAAIVSKTASPNGTALGSWRLDTVRDDLGNGAQHVDAILAYNDAWDGAIADTTAVMRGRGAAVAAINDGATWIATMQSYAATCAAGDRLFLYIGADGSDPRTAGDLGPAPSEGHGWQMSSGFVTLGQIAPSLRAIALRGVDLNVLDGACFGGETVLDAAGQGYNAMSTTSVGDVALQNNPDPGAEFSGETKPAVFGMWWSSPHLVGSRLNGRILLEMAHSSRIQQRLYRNDGTSATAAMLFGRPALAAFYWLRSWWLDVDGCYLFPLLWPTQAAAETPPSGGWVNGIEGAMTAAANAVEAHATAFANYQAGVLTPALATPSAGALYAAHDALVWQCLVDDLSWDVGGQPSKYQGALGGLSPASYAGAGGFVTLANDAHAAVLSLQACYEKERSLITAIDAAVRASPTLGGKAPPPNGQIKLDGKTLEALRISTERPEVVATMNAHSVNLRTMAERVRVTAPQTNGVPTADVARQEVDMHAASWTADALSTPTGDPTVDKLAAQLMGTYSLHEATAFRASFQLSIVEDAVCASQSANQAVVGDMRWV